MSMWELEALQEEIGAKIEEYVRKREAEIIERLRGALRIKEWGWGGKYEIWIEGHHLYATHDAARHRWSFTDEEHGTIFETSEKKGETIMEFLTALAKIFSSRDPSSDEEIIAGDDELTRKNLHEVYDHGNGD